MPALTLTALIGKTQQLSQAIRLIPPDSFKEKLYEAYRGQVLTHLQKILDQSARAGGMDADDERLKKLYPLRICLQTLWESFKRSPFCYTALHDDVNQLCCEIAEHLSEQYDTLLRKLGKRDTKAMQEGFHLTYSPLALLMPHVVLEYTHATYATPRDLWQQDLKMILRSHILDESGYGLLPVLTLAREPLIISPGHHHHLCLINPSYKSLLELDEIRKQREACLTESGEQLTAADQLYARLLAERLATQNEKNEERRCQHLPLNQTEHASYELMQGLMRKSEISRMSKHSPETIRVYTQWRNYHHLIHNKDHLLGQLNLLIKNLYVNSVKGNGTEEVAGPDAEKAIGRFQIYYEALSEEAKGKIPPEVKRVIDFIIDVTFNPEVNMTASLSDLCASDRNKALKRAITGHEEALASIGLTESAQSTLIRASISELEKARNQLQDTLTSLHYHGQDLLSLTHKTLEALGQSFEINNLADTLILQYASPAEIKTLFAGQDKASLRKNWIHQIGQLDDFVLCLLELSDEQLYAFFQVMGKDLLNPPKNCIADKPYLKSEKELSAILALVTPSSAKAIIKGLRTSLDSSEDLNKLLSILPIMYYKELNFSALGYLTKNLAALLTDLTPEKCNTLYNALKTHHQLCEVTVESIGNLVRILYHLTPAQSGEVCSLPNFSSIVQSPGDRRKLFSSLKQTKHASVYEALGGMQGAALLVRSAKDFVDVLPRPPTSSQTTALYEELKKQDQLGSLTIALLDHACAMIDQLTVDQCREVCGLPNFASSMKSAKKFSDTLQYLNSRRCGKKDIAVAIYECLGGAVVIAEFIQSTTNLKDVLLVLPKEERTAVFDTLKAQDKLDKLTVDPDCDVLYKILERLNRDQRQELCNTVDLAVLEQQPLTKLKLKFILNTFSIKRRVKLGHFFPQPSSPARDGLFATGRNPTAHGNAARRRAAARREIALGQATTPPPPQLHESEYQHPRGYFSA